MGRLSTGSQGSLGTSNEISIPHDCTDQLRQSQFVFVSVCMCMCVKCCPVSTVVTIHALECIWCELFLRLIPCLLRTVTIDNIYCVEQWPSLSE